MTVKGQQQLETETLSGHSIRRKRNTSLSSYGASADAMAASMSSMEPLLTHDIWHPFCVASCPEPGVSLNCTDYVHPNQTVVLPGYQSELLGEAVCAPSELMENAYMKQSKEALETLVLDSAHAWALIAALSGVIALIMNCVYLIFLMQCAGPVFKILEVLMFVSPLMAGFYFVNASGGVLSGALLAGVGLISLSLIFLACYCCCMQQGVDISVACLEASGSCLFAEPTLLLVPLTGLATKATVSFLMVPGLLTLVGCGELEFSPLQGFFGRTLTHSYSGKVAMAFYLTTLIWSLQIITGTVQYVIAYTSEHWYFTPYVGKVKEDLPSCLVCKAFSNCLIYHFGSIAFGGGVSMLLWCLQFVIGGIDVSECSNQCVACMACVCEAVVACMSGIMRLLLTKGSYMVMALTSMGYRPSCDRAMEIVLSRTSALTTLLGSTLVFEIGGYMAVWFGTVSLLSLCIEFLPVFSDPVSSHYVTPNDMGSFLIASFVSFCVSHDFMVTYSMASETLFFCYAIDCARHTEVVGNISQDDADANQGYLGAAVTSVTGAFSCAGARKVDDGHNEMKALILQRSSYTPPQLEQLIEDHGRG
eukprot:TRINITY_DN39809_c0_g1_i1.p1 TRINITY_DN39809_c0_g1~~TRINITY_DN39809_c0_g1_i1.p1  ORF type:complete len:688 (-),score=79.53 TRINITY_DN39809_c0_g1_i1:72-1841(-)